MPERGPYNCCRTYDECTFLIRNFHTISFISLDYDLMGRETGYDVLKYMVECGNHVKHINIHSDHSIGVPKTEAYVKEHFPNAELTFNPLESPQRLKLHACKQAWSFLLNQIMPKYRKASIMACSFSRGQTEVLLFSDLGLL